jgi:hypothetical protein
MEHIGYPTTSIKNTFYFAIQVIITPFFYVISAGCKCYRQTRSNIEKAGFESLDLHFEYANDSVNILRPNIWGTAKTSKTQCVIPIE